MSSKSNKKRQRQLAAQRERQRRQELAKSSSPLSSDELDALWLAVATEISANGHLGDFSLASDFLEKTGADAMACIDFFTSHRMKSDFDILLKCDPRVLFGAEDQHRRMPISEDQLNQLLDYLDASIPQLGCDHTTKLSAEWLRDRELPVTATLMACLSLGGGCDCEILFNVEPVEIYKN